ncbi:MAG: SIMPL domain-containing protein [Candidatus Wildermuthbacteria bacterium]|nr:SIMPL domain-containing protein [Candidatus Wildermuthbacteria bacterium]
MDNRIKNTIGIAVIIALLALVYGVLQYGRSIESTRSFTSQGEGKVVAIPDIAQFSFGVVSEGGTDVSSLQNENSVKANSIIDFLKAQGIESKDIKTESYSIEPRYQYFSCPFDRVGVCPPAEIVGYTVRNQVSVKIRDFAKIGAILAGTVEKGANSVSQVSFAIDNILSLQQQAREEAIQKAKEEAKRVAKTAGFRLGRLVSLNEGGFGIIPVFQASEARGGATPPVLEPGSQEVIVQVTLTYEIR